MLSGKGCGAGCLTMVAAFFAYCGIYAGVTDGGVALAVFFLIMGAVPGWLAFALVRGDQADRRARAERLRQQQERQILQVAAQHDGQVTPALVTMNVPHVTIAQAKAILDSLAKDGFCAIDSDPQGNVFYAFDLGQHTPRAEAAPDEWVSQAARSRLTGEADETQSTTR